MATIITSSADWVGLPDEPVTPNIDLLGDDCFIWSAATRFSPTGKWRKPAASEGSFSGYAATRQGRGAKWSRSISAGVNFGVSQPFTSNSGITMAVVWAPVSSANRKIAFSQRLPTGSFASFFVGANMDSSFTASAGMLVMGQRNTGPVTSAVSVGSGSSGIDGNLHCWVLGNSTVSSSGYIHRDGETLTISQTAMSGTYLDATQQAHVGNAAGYTVDGNLVNDDPLLLVVGWSRRIDEARARDISRILSSNVGEAFEPVRIWVPVSAGGAATHTTTGSLVSDAAVVAGTALHPHTTTGALVAESAVVAGAALHPHTTSGALVADAAVVDGVATLTPIAVTHETSGALVAGAATVSGQASGPRAGGVPGRWYTSIKGRAHFGSRDEIEALLRQMAQGHAEEDERLEARGEKPLKRKVRVVQPGRAQVKETKAEQTAVTLPAAVAELSGMDSAQALAIYRVAYGLHKRREELKEKRRKAAEKLEAQERVEIVEALNKAIGGMTSRPATMSDLAALERRIMRAIK